MAHDVIEEKAPVYGLLAEFESPDELLQAVIRSKEEGYSEIDAFSPYPVEPISEEVCNHKKSKVSTIVGIGALLGALFGFGLQYWVSAIEYPLNIGGRPLLSWPAFIPVTFELAVLFGSFSALIGMLVLNDLPKPYHPVFNVERFEHASVDRFFLLIESKDAKFDQAATRNFLEELSSEGVFDVDW